jgi:cell division protein FtsA
MSKRQIITGLDIGTNSIKILVAARKNGEEKLEAVSQIQEPSFGVRKGIIIDPEKVARIIQIALNRARTEISQKFDSVYVNIGGSHIFSTSSRGKISVSRADGKISEEDVKRVLQDAETFPMPLNKEILETFPKEFIIDGEGGVKEPVGMRGVRLESEVLVLAGFSPFKKNLTQAVLGADLQISDVLPSPLASSISVLTPKQKELGVALLDI